MTTYVRTTGVLFALLVGAHLWRMVVERNLLTDPWYIAITLTAGGLSAWAWRVQRHPG